jgi:formiminotetrahydrofolate cyclodeaminase
VYLEKSLKQYLDDLFARVPAPGGGSVAAVVASLAVGLVGMVANFTTGKEKYQGVAEKIRKILSSAQQIKKESEKLIDLDVESYKKVSAAYRLPKTTSAEKEKRTLAIQSALKEAAQVPFQLATLCGELFELGEKILHSGNKNLLSDAKMSLILTEAAYRSALINVEVNLAGIKDEEFNQQIRAKLKPLSQKLLGQSGKLVPQ